jgi:Tfp pilus assembly protein PilN
MRAVNLIPSELRGGGRAPGRTGIAPYVVLGALALLVAMVGVYTLATRSLHTKQAEVTSVEAQATAAEARTHTNASFAKFAELTVQRTQTVKSLAASRFDWAHALAEVARVLPSDAWLSSMRATVTPGASVDGTADPLRASLSLPAIELVGCTTSQANVARVVADLRRADGVKRVSLSSAQKSEAQAGATSSSTTDAATAGADGDCTQGKSTRPKFSLTLFYDAPATPTAATATGATGTGATTTGTSAGTTPAPSNNVTGG